MGQNFNFERIWNILHKKFAHVIKRPWIEKQETATSLQEFTACRLIPLDEKSGLRPIGVGEVLRRIAGKVIIINFKRDIADAAGSLQLSAGQEVGARTPIYTMWDMFANEDTEAALLIDAKNAFNSISLKVMLHNLNFLCPIIKTYITNYYIKEAKLFITGVVQKKENSEWSKSYGGVRIRSFTINSLSS